MKTANQEGEFKRRTKKTSQKEKAFSKVKTAMSQSATIDELIRKLHDQGLKIYNRGKSSGVQDTQGKRYRFKTLGLDQSFKDFIRHSQSNHTESVQKTKPEKSNDGFER